MLARRTLGRNGPPVSALGLGCYPMSGSYGPGDDEASIATIQRALELGITLLDSSDAYGRGHNEELIARALAGQRERAFVATKFGMTRRADDPDFRGIDGSPAYVRAACEASLRRLRTDVIDLYYQHRVDPKVPIAETVGAMAELVRAGKVRWLGLCEARPDELRAAAAVHPIAALQSEYSLFSRDIEDNGVLATIRELGIALVPYSPLGRGWLTGTLRSPATFSAMDYRRGNPRFQSDTFARNQQIADGFAALAGELGTTPPRLALAWVLARGDDVVPIPGTKHRAYVEDNVGALDVAITPALAARIDAAVPKGAVSGKRTAGRSFGGRI
jgi:aryl-alcohol dehydrogenase-like predicted oxidoreductase